MITDLVVMRSVLINISKECVPPLMVRKDNENTFELAGTKEVMQGKQKVDGYYFASIVPKPKDVRLYFFPIYTHVDEYEDISEEMKKCLKGKSCFHIKKLSPDMEVEIRRMMNLGIELYRKDELI